MPPDPDDDEDKLQRLLAQRAQIDESIASMAREVAVMFTDIKNSTRFFEERGDLEGMAYLKRHNDLLFPIVRNHGGRIVKTIGDAIMAVFDRPLEAATAGAEMQRALHEMRQREKRDPIHIRCGLHWGSVMVQGDDVFGDTVNTASRIEGKAVPDEVVISRPLMEALPAGAFEVIPRGAVAAKGKAEPVEVFSLRWGEGAPAVPRPEPPPASRGAVPADPDGDRPEHTPAGQRTYEVFVLEIAFGSAGLKVSALDGAGDKGTVKAYEEVPLDRAGLDALAEPFGTFLRTGGASGSYLERVRGAGQSLFARALSARVQTRLRSTEVQFLRVHLDDDLVHVPWELGHDGNEFLALHFAIGRMVSARAKTSPTIAPLDAAGEPVAVVVSNPSGDLAAAAEEGRAVSGLLQEGFRGTVRHLEGPVTKAAFLASLRGARVLHFAGHAQRGSANVRGGFRLADGIATPEEIAAAVGQRAPALVFANSCHATGGGWTENQQGVFNLASALLMRGAQHFVGPTWEVPDADALAFALRFYENALAGIPFGESVRLARGSLASSAKAPLSFAGYVLYGEPRQGFPAGLVSLVPQSTRGAAAAAVQMASAAAGMIAQEAPRIARKRPFMRTRMGRSIVGGAAVLGSVAALGELLVSWKTLFPGAAPASTSAPVAPGAAGAPGPGPDGPAVPVAAGGGAPLPGGTQVAMVDPATASPLRHEGPVRIAFMPLKNLSQSELPGVEFTLQEAGIAGLAQAEIAVVERGQLDDRDRQQYNTVFDELILSNNAVFWDEKKRNAFGLQQGAEVVVLGGFQKSGKVVRLNARFVNVETGEILHSLKLDEPLNRPEQIFDLQDAFEAEVAKAVPVIKKKLRP